MNEVFAVGLFGLQADMRRIEQNGMNLANASSTAYKRLVAIQAPVTATFAAQLAQASASASAAPEADAVPGVTLRPDMRPGTLKSTGEALDFALAGDGFFEVVTPEGPAYTRQGSLRLDASGRLVTAQGHPVMGTNGEITLATAKPSVHANGAVFASAAEEAAPIAQLRVVSFEKDAVLERLGDGLYRAGSGMKVLAPEDVQVRQGFLENANVSPAHEMTQLVRTMRHFESMQKIVQGYDEMLGTAIRKLGENA